MDRPKLEAWLLKLRYEWLKKMSRVERRNWRRTLFTDEKSFASMGRMEHRAIGVTNASSTLHFLSANKVVVVCWFWPKYHGAMRSFPYSCGAICLLWRPLQFLTILRCSLWRAYILMGWCSKRQSTREHVETDEEVFYGGEYHGNGLGTAVNGYEMDRKLLGDAVSCGLRQWATFWHCWRSTRSTSMWMGDFVDGRSEEAEVVLSRGGSGSCTTSVVVIINTMSVHLALALQIVSRNKK